MLWLGILLHGICYDFFFVTGQIYIDRKSSPAFRAAAQGTITLITYGLGMLLGSWLSGRVVDLYARTSADGTVFHLWRPIWLVSAGCSAGVLLLFLATFSAKDANATMAGLPAEEMAEGVPL
jgi:MFS family permease